MNRKRSLGLMKAACAVTFILGLALFGAAAPVIVMNLPDGGVFGNSGVPELAYVEAVGVLCFLSLWQAWKVCGEIGRDNSFSHENAASLRKIARYMAAACVMMAAGAAACVITGNRVLFLAALGACIALIFSLFAAAMAQLIEAGARIKEENDLTI